MKRLIVLTLFAASCSNVTPSPVANVVHVSSPVAVCTPGGCYVRGIVYNTGPSCALAIHGASFGVSWTGPTILRPAESAPYAGCCAASLPPDANPTIAFTASLCP